MWYLHEIAAMTDGALIRGNPLQAIHTIVIDSRQVTPGALFVALPGVHTDGHLYVDDAVQRGATAVLVHDVEAARSASAVIAVQNTWQALWRWASAIRDRLSVRILAITGSIGKTTTKELIGEIARQVAPTVISPGNWNSISGVPLSLIHYGRAVTSGWWIQEVGINRPGEMVRIAGILRPHHVVILNVAPVHLAELRDLETVAHEKAMLLWGLVPGGTVMISADQPELIAAVKRHNIWQAPVMTFGHRGEHARWARWEARGDGMDITIAFDTTSAADVWTFQIARNQPWVAHNLLPAVAVARYWLCAGPETIARALRNFRPPPHRGQVIDFPSGWTLIDDSYNANPVAVEVALRWFGAWPATRRGVVLGDMLELGDQEQYWHAALAERVDWTPFQRILLVGTRMHTLYERLHARFGSACTWYTDVDALIAAFTQEIQPGDAWLVKASRALRLDRLVASLMEREGIQRTSDDV